MILADSIRTFCRVYIFGNHWLWWHSIWLLTSDQWFNDEILRWSLTTVKMQMKTRNDFQKPLKWSLFLYVTIYQSAFRKVVCVFVFVSVQTDLIFCSKTCWWTFSPTERNILSQNFNIEFSAPNILRKTCYLLILQQKHPSAESGIWHLFGSNTTENLKFHEAKPSEI